MIRCFVNYDKDDWDEHLLEFEVAHSASVHSKTAHTPFFLNYGLHPRTIPAELIVPENHPSIQESLINIKKSSIFACENIVKKNSQMC